MEVSLSHPHWSEVGSDTGDSCEDTAKNLFREPRLRFTSNNSVKNTIITAASCLVELKSFDFTTPVVGPTEEI